MSYCNIFYTPILNKIMHYLGIATKNPNRPKEYETGTTTESVSVLTGNIPEINGHTAEKGSSGIETSGSGTPVKLQIIDIMKIMIGTEASGISRSGGLGEPGDPKMVIILPRCINRFHRMVSPTGIC